MVDHETETRPAFLTLLLGGLGLAAGRHLHQLYELDRRPYPTSVVHIDTDPESWPFVDRSIRIPLDGQKVKTMIDSPENFGPVVATIVRHYLRYLNPEDIRNGARTIRLLTQLAFEYHRRRILRELRKAVLALWHRGGFDHVIPVLVSSSGGGTGSALQILLCQALNDRAFFCRLNEGFDPGWMHTPVLCVVEPFAFAMGHQDSHADKILGNAYAFRVESALLEEAHAYKYCFHLGLANRHGAVLDSRDEIAKVLGTSVYQIQRHWLQIKKRFVVTMDSNFSPYGGWNIPEVRRTDLRSTTTTVNGKAL